MSSANQSTVADRLDPVPGSNGQTRNADIGTLNLRREAELPHLVPAALPFRRTIRRTELHQLVPLADTTIYDMERRGEFPRRFNLTARCVVWDLSEVEAWIAARRQASNTAQMKRAPSPDVRRRKLRPVKAAPVS